MSSNKPCAIVAQDKMMTAKKLKPLKKLKLIKVAMAGSAKGNLAQYFPRLLQLVSDRFSEFCVKRSTTIANMVNESKIDVVALL